MEANWNNLDYYQILGVQRSATQNEIHAAYRRLVLIHHPDRHPDDLKSANERLRLLIEARKTLTNPITRQAYDKQKTPHTASASASAARSNQRTQTTNARFRSQRQETLTDIGIRTFLEGVRRKSGWTILLGIGELGLASWMISKEMKTKQEPV